MESGGVRERPSRPPPPATRTSTSGHSQQNQVVTQIKQLQEEAYLYIEQGLTCDEQGQTEQAVTLYTKGLRSLDLALHKAGENHSLPAMQEDHVQKMLQKVSQTKVQMQSRVEMLIQSDAAVARSMDDPPPSYEEAITPTLSDFDMALQESMLADDTADGQSSAMVPSAREVFSIADGVQIFFITPEGYVSAPSYPSKLGIYCFSGPLPSDGEAERPPAFLKVGDWVYPLVPGHSPALQSEWGAYIFPDTASPGSAVGVIIPDTVSGEQRSQFENMLNFLTDMRYQQERAAVPRTDTEARGEPTSGRTSVKISQGIVTAAEWISWGLGKGAQKTGQLLKAGSTKIQEKVRPNDEDAKIDPRVQKGAHYARQATGTAVKVSGYLVAKLGQATSALAKEAAPHLRKGGEKILPKSWTTSSSGGPSKMEDIAEVAVGGLKGWATVYVGLEQAAKVLAKSLADETVNVVQHKYGEDAGKLTENTVYSVTNVAVAAHTASNLGVKAVAKRAAKDTGKAVVADYSQTKKTEAKDKNAVEAGEKPMEVDETEGAMALNGPSTAVVSRAVAGTTAAAVSTRPTGGPTSASQQSTNRQTPYKQTSV